MVVEVDKEELLWPIQHKKIILLGTGEKGRRFYGKYKEMVDIRYASSNLDNETIGNLERIEWKSIIGCSEYFIVVCSAAENKIAYEFMLYGLQYGKDFVNQSLAEALLDKKEIVLLVGQCELEFVDCIFKTNPKFMQKYAGFCYREYDVLGINDQYPKLEISLMVNVVIGCADYFIYPVNLSKERLDYYGMLLGKIELHCKTAGVPLTTFEAYWPQDSEEYYRMSIFYKKDAGGKYPFGGRRDLNLESSVENGTVQEMVGKVLQEDFYPEDAVWKLFRKTIRKYRILEKKADITISDFLEENYRKRRVFLDRGHVCDFVLKEYAKRIAEFLGLDLDLRFLEEVDLEWYNQCQSEQPIYPSVQKCLEFTENTEYRFWVNGKLCRATMKGYMESLCNYMSGIKKLDEKCFGDRNVGVE